MQNTERIGNVLLINPAWRQLDEPFEHLGLGYLAASLRQAGIDATILDVPLTGTDIAHIAKTVQETNVGLIGVSITFQESATEVLSWITKLKAVTGIPVVVGGIYPTFAAREIILQYHAVDFIIKGEGEETLVALAITLFAKGNLQTVDGLFGRRGTAIWESPDRPSVSDLDKLPWPIRDTLPQLLKQAGVASLLSSRGCYGRCTFCSVDAFFARFGAKYRLRSAEDVLAEMDFLRQTYGVHYFSFNDANFIGGKGRGSARARAIAEAIIQRGWNIRFSIQCRVNDVEQELFTLLKQAGLCKVFLGVESGSQAVLDRFQKDVTVEENITALKILSTLEIFVAMGFIMFDCKTSVTELNENMQFLQKVKLATGQPYLAQVDPVSKVLSFAGTKVEAQLKAENRYRGTSFAFSYRLADPIVEGIYQILRLVRGVSSKIKGLRGQSSYREFDWHTGKIKD